MRIPTVKAKSAASSSRVEITRWLGADNVERLRTTLAQAGVELTGSHTGRLYDQHFVADVQLEPDDVIRVRCAVDLADAPRRLLRRFSGAAGSVRCGLGAHGLHLLAETRVDGVGHLPHSLKEIRAGFALAFQPGAVEAHAEHPDEDSIASVRAAIEQTGWSKDEAVETAEGFELQPRMDGSRIAVQVVLRPGAALIKRTVLNKVPGGIPGDALAHQALVWNAGLRCCRLAICGAGLCVESRLHAERLDREWLSFAARAVAAAARCLQPEVELLAYDPDVAQAYADMFGIASEPVPVN